MKDTEKGPKIVEVKHGVVYPQNENGLPTTPHHLLVVRDVLSQEIKYFLSNAPQETKVAVLLKVAFSRWSVERCFEDDKNYVGLDHFEGRGYQGLMRHLILSAVSLLFLSRARLQLNDKYPELTVSQIRQAVSALVQSWWLKPFSACELVENTAHRLEYYQRRNAQARASHTKTRLRRLLEMGIAVTEVCQCTWDGG